MAQPFHPTTAARTSANVITTACAVALLACSGIWLALSLAPCEAFAEDIDTDPQPDALQLEVERSAQAYDEAVSARDAITAELAENEARVAELEQLIPEQQRRSERAAIALYKSQQDTLSLVDLLLGSTSIDDFLFRVDAMNRVAETNRAELAQLGAMREELAATAAQLETERADAEASVNAADRALTAAQAARLEAQRRAEEEALRQAEAAAAAAQAAAAQEPQEEESSENVEAQVEQATEVVAVSSDGADWTSDQATFVAEWSARIDAYLAGSALAGQGAAFAEAAWNYGVDPRWSPAIAYLESSLGAYCFASHNAWGWGDCEWDTWEEAINDHVRGLARGYGYTISIEAAQKYCPPNWQHWYDVVSAQMNLI